MPRTTVKTANYTTLYTPAKEVMVLNVPVTFYEPSCVQQSYIYEWLMEAIKTELHPKDTLNKSDFEIKELISQKLSWVQSPSKDVGEAAQKQAVLGRLMLTATANEWLNKALVDCFPDLEISRLSTEARMEVIQIITESVEQQIK